MSEEERRRCILLGGCPPGTNLTQAWAEEMAAGAGDDPAQWKTIPRQRRERYLRQARHMAATFRVAAVLPIEGTVS